jgi:hypothetical protein
MTSQRQQVNSFPFWLFKNVGIAKNHKRNGTGNLILGYDEAPGTQTGSHNLLLGGVGNQASAENASVSGGKENKATGEGSSVSGGGGGEASGTLASVTGCSRRRP